MEKSDLNRVTVNTTVQVKAMTCPTDAKVAGPSLQAAGKGSSISWIEASPKLCISGSEATCEGEPLCACSSDEANEGKVKKLRTILVRVVRDV